MRKSEKDMPFSKDQISALRIAIREEIAPEFAQVRAELGVFRKEVREENSLNFVPISEEFRVVHEQFRSVHEQFQVVHQQLRVINEDLRVVNNEVSEFKSEAFERFDQIAGQIDGLYLRDEKREQEYLALRNQVQQLEKRLD